jgi:cyclic pyranopterin monophosphate synthase
MSDALTHLDAAGRPIMVDVSAKTENARVAVASGRVLMSAKTLELALTGGGPKGDVANIAIIAGIQGAKKTSDLIPMCHPLPITGANVRVEKSADGSGLTVFAEVKTTGRTGVEMEALAAVSVACLTIYDMLKAVDKAMVIDSVQLLEKRGGKSGDWVRPQESAG